MKACFKCGQVKPLIEFYRHSEMADGHLNKCKECTKTDVQTNYRANREKKSEYERKRFANPERRSKAIAYQRSRRKRDPQRSIARNAISNALRAGRLARLPCQMCGSEKTEAHHTDYSKPLDVMWLCRKHHLEQHNKESYKFADGMKEAIA